MRQSDFEQLITIAKLDTRNILRVRNKIEKFCRDYGISGTEVSLSNLIPRNELLWQSDSQKSSLQQMLKQLGCVRIHCSYWAEPTDFLTKLDFDGLIQRFNGVENVKDYFGDLSGDKMFARWAQEYELAKSIGAKAVTFHLIDYFHIDGLWDFKHTRDDVVGSMITMTQRLLDELDSRGLLEGGPIIELENAGFGLEYGVQRADDYQALFEKVSDPKDKLRIAWDINHLLHAVGIDAETGKGAFFLTESEVTPAMKRLLMMYSENPVELASQWVAHNVLDPRTAGKVSAVHLSDKHLGTIPYFRNGQLIEPYLSEIKALKSEIEQEEYGVSIVLDNYDSHEPLGTTLTGLPDLLRRLAMLTPRPPTIIHELKNNELETAPFKKQLLALR